MDGSRQVDQSRQMQQSYQLQSSRRIMVEATRSRALTSQAVAAIQEQVAEVQNEDHLLREEPGRQLAPVFHSTTQQIEEPPPAELSLAQFVLDWEFLHDLDLHLLKLKPSSAYWNGNNRLNNRGSSGHVGAEDLWKYLTCADFVDPVTGDLSMGQQDGESYKLEKIVSYSDKVYFDDRWIEQQRPRATQQFPERQPGWEPSAEPEVVEAPKDPTKSHRAHYYEQFRHHAHRKAVIQLDRNASVYSVKPVENLWITRTIEPGFYVCGVHNYCMRCLYEDVSRYGNYTDLHDLMKRHPIFKQIAEAQELAEKHTDDPDSDEKAEIMKEVDRKMTSGCQQLTDIGLANPQGDKGIHYGVTVYGYKYDQTMMHHKKPGTKNGGAASGSATTGSNKRDRIVQDWSICKLNANLHQESNALVANITTEGAGTAAATSDTREAAVSPQTQGENVQQGGSSSSSRPPPSGNAPASEPLKHPQDTTDVDALDTNFEASFFMTHECVYDEELAKTMHYDAKISLADRNQEDLKKAIPYNWASHICIIKIVPDESKADRPIVHPNGVAAASSSSGSASPPLQNAFSQTEETLSSLIQNAKEDGVLPRRSRIGEIRMLRGIPVNAPLDRPAFVRGNNPGLGGGGAMQAHRRMRMRGNLGIPEGVPENNPITEENSPGLSNPFANFTLGRSVRNFGVRSLAEPEQQPVLSRATTIGEPDAEYQSESTPGTSSMRHNSVILRGQFGSRNLLGSGLQQSGTQQSSVNAGGGLPANGGNDGTNAEPFNIPPAALPVSDGGNTNPEAVGNVAPPRARDERDSSSEGIDAEHVPPPLQNDIAALAAAADVGQMHLDSVPSRDMDTTGSGEENTRENIGEDENENPQTRSPDRERTPRLQGCPHM